MRINSIQRNIVLVVFIILKIALQFHLVSSDYTLHRDEFLHLDQGQHPDWGFISVPPLTSWISYLIYLLGNSVFWIKFFPALFGALTLVVVWKTIEELNGGWFALVLGAISVLFSVILRINILYQPNSLDILLWTVVYYAIIKYIKTEKNNWLYVAGISFAFGFLNKYNIAFLVLGIIPALLLTAQRKVLVNKHLYYAVGLAFVIVLPNLIWQYQNNFPVVHHMKELQETQLEKIDKADFLKEQILFFLGSFFVLIISFIGFWIFKPFKNYRVFFWSFIMTMFFFVILNGKAYYTIGLYPVLLGFGAVYTEKLLEKKWLLYLRPVCILIPLFLFLPLYQLAFPNKSPEKIKDHPEKYKELGMLRWEDGKDHDLPQDFADMLGWDELAQKTDKALETIGDTDNVLVLCDNYGQAGAINFYKKNKSVSAVSFNADYVNWFPLDKKIETVILVKEAENKLEAKIFYGKIFSTVKEFDSVQNNLAREYGTTIFILKKPKTDINAVLKKWIAESKE